MIIAKRKINTVDARAIIRCGIGARNRRNTKIRRMLMIVDTIRTQIIHLSLHGHCIKRFFCTRRWAGRKSQGLLKAVGVSKGDIWEGASKCATQLSKAFF
jgi:hypothetical protein